MEADRRRFFLNECVVGESVLVSPEAWAAKAELDSVLEQGAVIALGFDGSKKRDATALVASRISDGRLFRVRIWERPADAGPDWTIPALEVDKAVRDAFAGYTVTIMFADPYRWQDYLDTWAAAFPDRVVEFPTNVEQRMDRAIERFSTAFGNGEVTHSGDETLTRHMLNAVIVKGGRKKPRPGEDDLLQPYYLKLAKRGDGRLIDGAVAAVLAHEGRAHAIEHGLIPTTVEPFALLGG
jgi:phage terminase large subunit-like protein